MKLTKRIIDGTTYQSWQDEQVTLLEKRWRGGHMDEAEFKAKVDTVRNGYAGKSGERQFKPCILWDDQVKGFGLRITPANVKSFIYKYRTRDRRTRVMKVCRYGDKTVDEARTKAGKLRGNVDDERDPLQERREKQRKAVLARRQQLRDLGSEFIKHQKDAGRKSWPKDEQRLERDVFPVIGDTPAGEVKQRDVEQILDRIQRRARKSGQKRGGNVQARRTRTLLVSIFNYALTDPDWRQFVQTNPALLARKPKSQEKPRERELDAGELQRLWLAADELHPDVADAFRFRMLTGQRWSEVRSMQWKDVATETADLHGELVEVDRWMIPRERTKSLKHNHVVPLSLQAVQILEQRRERRDREDQELEEHERNPKATKGTRNWSREMKRLEHARKRVEAAKVWVFPFVRWSKNLEEGKKEEFLGDCDGALRRWRKEAEVEADSEGEMRLTDVRRTVISGMAKLGVRLEVQQAVANHTPQDVTRKHYNRYDYLAEKRDAMIRWAEYVDSCLSDEPKQAKVVRMPQR